MLAPDDHGGNETDMERCAAVCAAFPNTDGMPILGFWSLFRAPVCHVVLCHIAHCVTTAYNSQYLPIKFVYN